MRQTILVVDDEPDVVDLIATNLRARGYEVATAGNGIEAVIQARKVKPSAIVLDVMMEGMDGLSACEILRAQPDTRGIPVLILTAAVGEMARMSSFAAGAADFVCKPFSPRDLCRRIEELVKR